MMGGDRSGQSEASDTRRLVTMMDVAAAAGVPQTTVSLVLNGALGARLSHQTRQRVMEAAKSLGYRLNKRGTAKPPASGPTVIGFVADEISTDPWCAIARDSAHAEAWQLGFP